MIICNSNNQPNDVLKQNLSKMMDNELKLIILDL